MTVGHSNASAVNSVRRWLLILVAPLTFLSIANSTVAQVGPNAGEIERAWAALAGRDCEAAWNILWPLAKNGDVEARYFLYSATLTVIPPGVINVNRERSSYFRHVLALSAYAALRPRENYASGMPSDGLFARNDVPASIRELNLGEPGERVSQCYKSDPSLEKCLKLGVSLGVIPKFDDYARETERIASESGATARCLPRH
jgi:hypothetical protein